MKPYKLEQGDCLELIKQLPDNSVTAIVTDPPYHLKASNDSDVGFMGREWDGGDVAFRRELWSEALRVAKPGSHLLAFGGTRTFHRLTCAIEDAGWKIMDCAAWMYGQGFAKSMNIGKAIDKSQRGVPQGKADPTSPNHGKYKGGRGMGAGPGNYMAEQGVATERELSEEASRWRGYGTSLKPAWEPIVIAMKPVDGTYVQNVAKWGVAGFNIDESRIATQDNLNGGAYSKNKHDDGQWGTMHRYAGREYVAPTGRWPANVLLTHDLNCKFLGYRKVKAITGGGGVKVPGKYGIYGKFDGHLYEGKLGYFDEDGNETVENWECAPECPIRLLDEQTAHLKQGRFVGHNRNANQTANKIYGKYNKDTKDVCYGDSGGASRFFYCAKSSQSEKHLGCEHLYWQKAGRDHVLISADQWETLDAKDRAFGNIHTTVKPLELMKYLCRLVMMPEGNVVLDPFAGSGTTLLAALSLSMRCVGFEKDASAVIVAESRLNHFWRNIEVSS